MRDRKELKECISLIKDRLKEPGMSDPKNSSVKAGYEKSIEILKQKATNSKGMGIEYLKTTQSRAIAMLAIDFVNGDITKDLLLSVPLKK